MKSITKIAVIIAIAVIAVVILAVPFVPVTEAYTSQDPIQRQCNYTVTSANQGDSTEWFGRWNYHWVTVVIENKDTKAGVFSVRFYAASGDLTGEKTVEHSISPGLTSTFHAEWDTASFQGMDVHYSVTAPMIQDTQLTQRTRTIYKSVFQLLTS